MNKSVLFGFLVVCLTATVQSEDKPQYHAEVKGFKEGKKQDYKLSYDKLWDTKEGQWSIGPYVEYTKDKHRYKGDAQIGFNIKGTFKG